jgi:phytoene/squalene synthetase
MNYIKAEHISQLMSIYQQTDKTPSKEDLLKITFTKGGISALALMYLMAPNMKEKEIKAIYELGAVMQLIDDISDIKEDLKSGIWTVPNQKLLTYQELKQLYVGTVNNLIENCGIDPHHPNGTLDMLCWFTDIMLEKRYKKLDQL